MKYKIFLKLKGIQRIEGIFIGATNESIFVKNAVINKMSEVDIELMKIKKSHIISLSKLDNEIDFEGFNEQELEAIVKLGVFQEASNALNALKEKNNKIEAVENIEEQKNGLSSQSDKSNGNSKKNGKKGKDLDQLVENDSKYELVKGTHNVYPDNKTKTADNKGKSAVNSVSSDNKGKSAVNYVSSDNKGKSAANYVSSDNKGKSAVNYVSSDNKGKSTVNQEESRKLGANTNDLDVLKEKVFMSKSNKMSEGTFSGTNELNKSNMSKKATELKTENKISSINDELQEEKLKLSKLYETGVDSMNMWSSVSKILVKQKSELSGRFQNKIDNVENSNANNISDILETSKSTKKSTNSDIKATIKNNSNHTVGINNKKNNKENEDLSNYKKHDKNPEYSSGERNKDNDRLLHNIDALSSEKIIEDVLLSEKFQPQKITNIKDEILNNFLTNTRNLQFQNWSKKSCSIEHKHKDVESQVIIFPDKSKIDDVNKLITKLQQSKNSFYKKFSN